MNEDVVKNILTSTNIKINTGEPNTIFITLKATITGLCSGFSIAFGWLGWLMISWVACMALDFITGSIAACKDGKWASGIAREGIYHKAGMMVVVLIAAIADGVIATMLVQLPSLPIPYTTALLPVVLAWYIFTELGSITENATAMGAAVPRFLTKVLAAGQACVEADASDCSITQ